MKAHFREPRATGYTFLPSKSASESGRDSHRPLDHCSYCGSMPPGKLAVAILKGATVHWADRKYGWPHKLYVDNIPNIYAGQKESVSSCTLGSGDEPTEALKKEYTDWKINPEYDCWEGKQYREAPATTNGKFYTEHLLDATQEEAEIIHRAMGIVFEFHEDGTVSWSPFNYTEK